MLTSLKFLWLPFFNDTFCSVPLAVIIGIPMYSNAAGVMPVFQALLAKVAALETSPAFILSVFALSLPEMTILHKVLSIKLFDCF